MTTQVNVQERKSVPGRFFFLSEIRSSTRDKTLDAGSGYRNSDKLRLGHGILTRRNPETCGPSSRNRGIRFYEASAN